MPTIAGPRRAVVAARAHGYGTIGGPVSFKYHGWVLDLECGHSVERRIRYLPHTGPGSVPRGFAALHQGVPRTRIPDQGPRHAYCEFCRAAT